MMIALNNSVQYTCLEEFGLNPHIVSTTPHSGLANIFGNTDVFNSRNNKHALIVKITR